MTDPLEVSDAEFDREVLEAEIPVLVDFWADWCAPCQRIAPILDELADEYDGRVKFVKVDTEENFDVTSRYGIRSVPTLLICQGGEQGDQVRRTWSNNELRRTLEKAVA